MSGELDVSAQAAPIAASGSAIALMYHALDGDSMLGQDPHYTLSCQSFRRHLAYLRDSVGTAVGARHWLDNPAGARVLITFDDGHVSNHRLALPLLLEFGMRADFFVNPATVGCPGFVGWDDLREMAAAGMSIQSHGYDHQYLTALSPQQLRSSLLRARLELEDRLGAPVTLLAPPGGRMPSGLDVIAQSCGYVRIFGSRPGRLRTHDARSILPRMAITSQCDAATLASWVDRRNAAVVRLQVRYHALAVAKRVLGNALYERARARMLPGPGARA